MSGVPGRVIAAAVLAAAASLPAAVPASSGSSPPHAAAGARPLLISNCKDARFKPPTVIIACGDAGLIAKKLQWSAWRRQRAVGSGTGVMKLCDPDCVSGGIARAPIRLTARKPRTCPDGRRLYSVLQWEWTDVPPTGPTGGSVPVGCKLAAL